MEVEGGDPLPHVPCIPRWEGSEHTQCVHGLVLLPEHPEHGGMEGWWDGGMHTTGANPARVLTYRGTFTSPVALCSFDATGARDEVLK